MPMHVSWVRLVILVLLFVTLGSGAAASRRARVADRRLSAVIGADGLGDR
jgi:hypothetical protein